MVETRRAKRKKIDVNVEISRKEVEKNAKKKKVEKNETRKTTEESATVTDDVLPMNYLVEAAVAVGSERSAPTSEEEKDGDEDGEEDGDEDEMRMRRMMKRKKGKRRRMVLTKEKMVTLMKERTKRICLQLRLLPRRKPQMKGKRTKLKLMPVTETTRKNP
ncbi:hypothetical protein F2Q68_00043802 [Brassica cretica]|uniref:Uncharacterized protein n=1 Tax=Brassica cretica TaxID=69181 RepID=A0A8S9LSV6_BRACR|nr:hypothetical protein F2Q68_00043802 [Brassica cretica]